MKLNYFDIGLYNGKEIDMFIKAIEPLNIEYNIHGFEAHPEYAKKVSLKYADKDNVNIHNLAITNKNGPTNLYIAQSNKGAGNSIFKTKNNVDPKKYIVTTGIVFSEWLKNNVILSEINIIRFNIEGAELFLIEDLIESEIYKDINIFFGADKGWDIKKCSEISSQYEYYINLLNKHNIIIHPFCASRRPPSFLSVEGIRNLIQNEIEAI